MKNISFMQLVLGTMGALLVYAGIKDLDLVRFGTEFVKNPAGAFQGTYKYDLVKGTPPSPTIPGNTTLPAPIPKPPQSV